jgi:hypothetical protein
MVVRLSTTFLGKLCEVAVIHSRRKKTIKIFFI